MLKLQRQLRTGKPNRLWRYSLVLACGLLLTSCSSTRMAYDFLDWAAMWKIDRLVSLDTQQRDWAKREVKRLHDWHRRTQLPRYADYVKAARGRIQPGKVTAEQLHAETDRIQLLLDDSLEEALPPATDIVSSLTDEQVAELLKSIAEERQEYIEETIEIGEEKLHEENAKKLRDHVKRFIGRLTPEQEGWVDEWSRNLEPYAELSAEQQLLWEEHLAKYLALRHDKDLLQKGLRELMLYRTDNWHPELQEAMDANQEKTYALLARLLNNLTDKQRKHLDKTMDGFIKDFRELARKGQ